MRKLISILCISILLIGCTQTKEQIKPEVNSVYYEIFVGSFNDSDGDGVGDLRGVIEKLDYIQDLGATGLWLMPIHPSTTYHKYDVLDYKDIDSEYGTLEDFDALIDELEKREMVLIIDLVMNHTSAKHPWFIEASQAKINGTCDSTIYCDYYNFSDTFEAGYTKLSQDVYYESVFWDQMPDLNLGNEDVKAEMMDIVSFWLERGVDGFRLDATTHFFAENKEKNIEYLRWFNDEVKKIKEDAYIVGEAWTSDAIVTDMFASNIDSFFNFKMSQNSGKIVSSLNNQRGAELAQSIVEYNQDIHKNNIDAIDAVFLSNHDNNRSAGYLADSVKQKMAASIYLLMPGNVFIYYGEEVGMKGSGKDENKRLPMPWSSSEDELTLAPKDADYSTQQPLTVDKAIKDKESLLNHYKKIVEVRNTYPEISRGNVEFIDFTNPAIYAIKHDTIGVIHNLSDEKQVIDVGNNDIIEISGKYKIKNGTLELDAYTSVLIVY